ncbi:MAG: hypothetical protein DMF69_08135 [Acidobacteria bacterium]|nr:MAG: hypothetical protein DMF69_08135 [Acidobacteriota bacterium]
MLLQANIFAGRGFAAKRPNFLPFYDIAILSKLTGLFDFVGRLEETKEIVRNQVIRSVFRSREHQ